MRGAQAFVGEETEALAVESILFFTRRSLAYTCILAMVISFTAFSSTPAAAADTYVVDSGGDQVDANPGNDVCNTTFMNPPTFTATGDCTLRAAIQESNADSVIHNTINFAVTVTSVVLDIPGSGEDASAEGDLDVTEDLTINGGGRTVRQTVEDRVFDVRDGAGVFINNLGVTGGSEDEGGGIRNDSFLDLNTVVVTGNAALGGGGIKNSGVFTGTAVIVDDNGASFGGGFYNGGFARLIGGDFGLAGGGNTATQEGGGIWNAGQLALTDTAIASNTAAEGGGIYNGDVAEVPASVRASGIEVLDNVAHGEFNIFAGQGGGIWNDSLLLMEFSTVDGNTATASVTGTATGGEGGGIYNVGGENQQQPTIESLDDSLCVGLEAFIGGGMCLTESTVSNNFAEGLANIEEGPGNFNQSAGKGGGIWNGSTEGIIGYAVLDRSDVTTNRAAHGGGLYSNHDAQLLVTQTAFVENTGGDPITGTAGGGAYVTGQGAFGPHMFLDSTFDSNSADHGGGVYFGDSGTNLVVGNTFSNNSANTHGGGIWNDTSLEMENSTVSGNHANVFGGGLYNRCCGVVSSTAVTWHENSAGDDGGNLWDSSPDRVDLRMSIVSGGMPNNCNTLGRSFPIFNDHGFNLEDDDEATCNFSESNNSIVGDDPLLLDLGDNGGETETHLPRSNSPAVDAVPQNSCSVDVDQRDVERPDGDSSGGGSCDIGAVEREADDGGGGGGSNRRTDQDPTPSPTPTPEPSTSAPAPPAPAPARPPTCKEIAKEFGLPLIIGTNRPDVLRGTAKAEVICAKDGNDDVRGLGGDDIIWLGRGADEGSGGGGDDRIRGNRGADLIRGGDGSDQVTAGRGDDNVQGGSGGDLLYGQTQNDELHGGPGNDKLYGDGGTDHCSGGPGTDTTQACDP